ncbi:htpn [Metamycoplasma buccale]|uniref:htpn n=1 Tax=Metamycoplasma buccale TaxID=55602 RepID=UPI00398F06AB
MESKEAIRIIEKKQEQAKNNVIENVNDITPNSYLQFAKYGAQTTLITLWSNFPKLFNNNEKEVTKEYVKVSHLLSLQKLETILYMNGLAALKSNFLPAFVDDFVEFDGDIRYLKARIEFISSKMNLSVIETWKYLENGELSFEYEITKPSNVSDYDAKKYLVEVFNYKPKDEPIIPYQIFYNNTLKISDLDLVNGEYFQLLNKDMAVLLKDAYLSAPWIFATDNSQIQQAIKNGLNNLNERFITLNPQIALYDTEPLRLLQGSSQAQIILQKIEKNVSWIKKFAFMKQDSADYGTKNMHTAEVQELNSDFEDYIESKSNLRELQLLEFLKKFVSSEIDKVLVYGSTEWLLTDAKKYAVNMNGSIVNQNAFLNNQDKGENTNGINEN